jgi:hypothetical protein
MPQLGLLASAMHSKVCTRFQPGSSWPQKAEYATHSLGKADNEGFTHGNSAGGGLGDEEGVDVAVFRFTLGIPGFEDRLIPRVVGAVGAALLALNHVLGAQPAPAAQVCLCKHGRQ